MKDAAKPGSPVPALLEWLTQFDAPEAPAKAPEPEKPRQAAPPVEPPPAPEVPPVKALIVIPEIRHSSNGRKVGTSKHPKTGEPIYRHKHLCEGLEIKNEYKNFEGLDEDAKGLFDVSVGASDSASPLPNGSGKRTSFVTRTRRWVTLPGALQMIATSPRARIEGTAVWHFRRWIFKDLVLAAFDPNLPSLSDPYRYKGHRLHHVDADGQRWYLLMDACEPLGIVDFKRAYERIDKDKKRLIRIVDPDRGGVGGPLDGRRGESQQRRFVNEAGLYQLVMESASARVEGTPACGELPRPDQGAR